MLLDIDVANCETQNRVDISKRLVPAPPPLPLSDSEQHVKSCPDDSKNEAKVKVTASFHDSLKMCLQTRDQRRNGSMEQMSTPTLLDINVANCETQNHVEISKQLVPAPPPLPLSDSEQHVKSCPDEFKNETKVKVTASFHDSLKMCLQTRDQRRKDDMEHKETESETNSQNKMPQCPVSPQLSESRDTEITQKDASTKSLSQKPSPPPRRPPPPSLPRPPLHNCTDNNQIRSDVDKVSSKVPPPPPRPQPPHSAAHSESKLL